MSRQLTAVGTCAKLWHDQVSIHQYNWNYIFVRFKLWAHRLWNGTRHSSCYSLNPIGPETRIFQENYVNTLAADAWALALSAAMVLTVRNKQVLVYHEEEFQLPVPSQSREIIRKLQTYFMFSKNSAWPGLRIASLSQYTWPGNLWCYWNDIIIVTQWSFVKVDGIYFGSAVEF